MAKKSKKVKRVSKQKYDLPELFAFSIIVLVIIICFAVVAYIVSARPL